LHLNFRFLKGRENFSRSERLSVSQDSDLWVVIHSVSVSKALGLSKVQLLFPARCLASDEADSNRVAERITLD